MNGNEWMLVPAEATERMVEAVTGCLKGSVGFDEKAAECRLWWNGALKASPLAALGKGGRPVTVEELAKHLYQAEDPASSEIYWPESQFDDGVHGDGGWVRAITDAKAAEYRERAAAILRFVGCVAPR